MKGWFTGYVLLIPFFFGNAVAQALIAVPCAVALRVSKKACLITWLTTLVLLALGVTAFIYSMHWPAKIIWAMGLPLAGIVIAPQALAYPLARQNPLLVIGVAFGIGLTIAILWVVLGILSGSTPD